MSQQGLNDFYPEGIKDASIYCIHHLIGSDLGDYHDETIIKRVKKTTPNHVFLAEKGGYILLMTTCQCRSAIVVQAVIKKLKEINGDEHEGLVIHFFTKTKRIPFFKTTEAFDIIMPFIEDATARRIIIRRTLCFSTNNHDFYLRILRKYGHELNKENMEFIFSRMIASVEMYSIFKGRINASRFINTIAKNKKYEALEIMIVIFNSLLKILTLGWFILFWKNIRETALQFLPG